MTIQQNAAGLKYGSVVEFLQLDLTPFGGGLFRIYNSMDLDTEKTAPLQFLGVPWTPLPYESEGWGSNGSGATPRPTIKIADFEGILLAASIAYQDLIGAIVMRYETTYDNIASGSYYGPEIWIVNQKMESDGMTMKIGLASPIDQKNKRLPAWQMFKDEFPALGHNRY